MYNKCGYSGDIVYLGEIGIGKMKVMDISKGWWSLEVEADLQAWEVSCWKLRECGSGM